MTTVTFDTDEAVQRLVAKGFVIDQAREIIHVVMDTQASLVTKTDLALALMPIKIGISLIAAGVGSIVVKAFFL